MKRNAKTILAVLLVAVTLLGLAAPALAETASVVSKTEYYIRVVKEKYTLRKTIEIFFRRWYNEKSVMFSDAGARLRPAKNSRRRTGK